MMRATIPNATTPGPESHTILRTGGTLRRAERRSRQLLQKFSFCDIWPESWSGTVVAADAMAPAKMLKTSARFVGRCARRPPKPDFRYHEASACHDYKHRIEGILSRRRLRRSS